MTMEINQKGSQRLKLVRSDRCLCPLCHNPRAFFYCSGCILIGDFSHSNSTKNEILAEKRDKLKKCSNKFTQSSQKIREQLEKRDEASLLAENKCLTKLRIRYLRKIIDEKRKKCRIMKEISERISSRISMRRLQLPTFERRTMKMRDVYHDYCLKVNRVRSNLTGLQISVADLRIKHMKDLVELIFPLEKVHLAVNKDEVDEDNDEVVDTLAEAMRTSYVYGRWITANSENSEEIQYRIVNPILPATGNHSSYYQDQAVMIDSCSLPPDALEVSLITGLSYVSQLVKLFAIFADIILPQKLSLSDFHSASPCHNESRFARRLAALNCNVVYLLCSIDEEFIIKDPLRSLQNIHSFITHLQNYPTRRLSTFNDHQIKNPEALVSHTKKIFAEVEKLIPVEENSSNNEDMDYSNEFDNSDVDNDWISVPNIEDNMSLTGPSHSGSTTSSIVTSFLRGFSGGSLGS